MRIVAKMRQWLLLALAVSGLAGTMAGMPVRAVAGSGSVTGTRTTWRVSVVRYHEMRQIPHTHFGVYSMQGIHYYVLLLRMTNTGNAVANPATDLDLVLRPPAMPGVRSMTRVKPMAEAAAKQFGGVLPWMPTRPGTTTTYCFLFGDHTGYAHYALYTYSVKKGYIFIVNAGF